MTNPAYGIEPAPTKVHYPAAVDSIVGDSSPLRSAAMLQPHGATDGCAVGNARARAFPSRCTRCNARRVTGANVHVRSRGVRRRVQRDHRRNMTSRCLDLTS